MTTEVHAFGALRKQQKRRSLQQEEASLRAEALSNLG
jgi:hypothetical protein